MQLSSAFKSLLVSLSMLLGPLSTAYAVPYSFSTFDFPGALSTQAFGINATGQIVGAFNDATGPHGSLESGGAFSTIDVANATFNEAFGVNAAGHIVGIFAKLPDRGFLDNAGIFTTIQVPSAAEIFFWSARIPEEFRPI